MHNPHQTDQPAQPYASPLLSHPGAVPDPATGVPLHFGDPLGEQRRMQHTATLIDRSHRTVLKVAGPDARTFLNNLLSQQLVDAPVNFSAATLDLDAQGHILHHAGVIVAGEEEILLDLPPQTAASFTDYLRKMVFWSQVEITETDLGVVTLIGGSGTPSQMPDGPARAGRVGADVLVERAALPDTARRWEADGGALAGLMAYTAARVRALEPEIDVDLDAKAIPHEVPHFIGRGGNPGAVHLNKGCYRGQETVARVENLGRSPRLLVMLQVDGSAPQLPEPGTPITSAGRTVGRLGTVAQDFEYGPIALGLVKRSALDSRLEAGGVALSVDKQSLPHDEGEHAGRRAVERLRQGQHNQ